MSIDENHVVNSLRNFRGYQKGTRVMETMHLWPCSATCGPRKYAAEGDLRAFGRLRVKGSQVQIRSAPPERKYLIRNYFHGF